MKISIFRDENKLRYEVERIHFRRAWHPFDEPRVQGLCAQLLPLAQSMTRPGKSDPEAFRQLETLSRALSRSLLPDEVLEELRADASHVALSIPPELDFIPWEWLHDGEDFWMRRHFTGRTPSRTAAMPPLPGRPLRMLVVVADPDRDLPHALREARTLVRELDRTRVFAARLMVNPRVNDLIRLFNLHAVVHYIGHMVVTDSPSGPVPAWKLADGTFGPAEIAAATFGGARVRLVFSNACPGTAMAPAVSARFPRAMQEAGIPAVVASIMDVPDPTASAMSAGFYSDLAAGRRIADVLSMARERARSRLPSGDITWMVHVLYGNPESIPLPAVTAEEASARVRLPGAVPYKPPRPGNWRRNLGRKLEIGLLLVLALATGYQLGRPLFAGKERFSPVVFPLRADDFSGRVLFSGFSGASISPDEILEAEQCFLRALTTLPEIRIEDARGAAMPHPAQNDSALEITGKAVSASSGGNRLLLWVRRVSDRVVLYADDFPLPLLDETPCVRLQDWIRQHRER